jgi:hypothetical protein
MAKTSGDLDKPYSAAVICFIPDYGHLQPLLKIADALGEAGFKIKCYIAEECLPLMSRFRFEYSVVENSSKFKEKKDLKKLFSHSIFFNSVCLYIHYLLKGPGVTEAVGRSATQLQQQLYEQQPDVIICDALWFVDLYERIAGALKVPLIVNSFDGSLAYSQREYVRIYGLTSVSPIIQDAVEIASAISRKLCVYFYRLRYFGRSLKFRAIRRTTRRAFEDAFPTSKNVAGEWIVAGTAVLERNRLGGSIRTIGANWREFAPLRFRSQVCLSKSLDEWIASDTRPIVYVSFGSAVEIDASFAKAVYEGLREVPARVLWSLPENQRSLLLSVTKAEHIRIESFVPQPEILLNPAVQCFVTQGGPHSVQEALFGGTPMVCIPFFVDQAYNSSVVRHLGVGIRLWRRRVSPQSISTAIRDILSNRVYLQKTQDIRDELIRNEGGAKIAQYIAELVNSSRASRRVRVDSH